MKESNAGLNSEHHKQLLNMAQKNLPGGILGTFTIPDDLNLVIAKGKGARVWDVDGNEYIDYVLGSGPLLLGHGHDSVVAAVVEQMTKGTSFYALNEPIIKLSQEVIEAVPCAEKVRFASSGSEATHYALRLARTFTKKEKILKFEGAYHGHHDYAMMCFTSKSQKFPKPTTDAAGIPKCIEDQVLVAPFNDVDLCKSIIDKHHEEIAAVLIEPYQRIYGPCDGFLEFIREITSKYSIVLIFDELVTGFRIAYGGCQEYYQVIPDLATYGKILGGGFPLSAVCGKAEIMDLSSPAAKDIGSFVYQSGTLNGNAICAAAGLATLKELKKPGVYEKLNQRGEIIRGHLENILRKNSIPAKLVGIGPMFNVLFGDGEIKDFRSISQFDKQKQLAFVKAAFKKGLFIDPRGFRSYISTVHSEEDIDQTLKTFEEVIATEPEIK